MQLGNLILIFCGIFAIMGFVIGMDFKFTLSINKNTKAKKQKTKLKEKIEILSGTSKPNFFKKQFVEVKKMLEETGQQGKYKTIKLFVFFLGMIGVALSYFFNNIWLAPVFLLAFSSIPFLYIRSVSSKYKKQVSNDLESSLSIITTSYHRSENIYSAVNENMHNIPTTIHPVFESFCFEIENINPNLITALNNMKLKINNPLFHEWINAMIQCDKDKKMKHILDNILEKFSTIRVIQSDLETALSEPKFEAIIMIVLVLGQIPMLKMLNAEWYQILLTTFQGKIGLAFVLAIITVCVIKIIDLSKPIEYLGEEE